MTKKTGSGSKWAAHITSEKDLRLWKRSTVCNCHETRRQPDWSPPNFKENWTEGLSFPTDSAMVLGSALNFWDLDSSPITYMKDKSTWAPIDARNFIFYLIFSHSISSSQQNCKVVIISSTMKMCKKGRSRWNYITQTFAFVICRNKIQTFTLYHLPSQWSAIHNPEAKSGLLPVFLEPTNKG